MPDGNSVDNCDCFRLFALAAVHDISATVSNCRIAKRPA